MFHSSTEIAFYIYCKDKYIKCEYNRDKYFKYTYNGKTYRYFPDFILNEHEFIEIKGDHFFKSDGTMYYPWTNKKWTEEEKIEADKRMEAKHQCMLKNNVKIIKSSECLKYNIYVKETYGNHYLEQFKNDTKRNFKS